jgi:hypothetical protein
VAIGFNDTKPVRRSGLVAIDVSKAFDSVNHTLLVEEIANLDLHSNYVCWLAANLHGCTASGLYNGSLSSPRIIRSGVPQGLVLFPVLFNYFVSDCPAEVKVNSAYADDINLLVSDPKIDVLSD